MVRREPLLIPAAALAAGILAAHLLSFSFADLLIPAFLTIALLCLSFRTTHPKLGLLAISFGLLLFGIWTALDHAPPKPPKMNAADGETVLLSGCVVNPPVFSSAREQFTLDLGRKANIRISVALKTSERVPLSYGQRVEVTAKVRSPRNFQNPDAFDFVTYLANQHIYWMGSVAALSDIAVKPGRCGSQPVAWLFGVRTWALGRLEQLYPGDPQTSGLLQATLLGETAGVERRWTNDFRVTGTYHALVISGQHISVLALSLLLILRLLQIRRIPALSVAATAAWLYAFISGFSAPVVRAAGGFTLFLVASYCFRRTRILNMLAAVGIVYLALDPDQLFDPSFQLSFLSAAAIAAFAIPLIERYTEPLRASVKRFEQLAYDPQVEFRAAQWRVEFRLFSKTLQSWTGLPLAKAQWLISKCVLLAAFLAEAVLVSACVQFGLALPMIAYFHRLSVTGLTANAIVVPLLSLVVPLGFASILTGWHILAVATGILLRWAELIATWHMRFEPSWRMAAIPVWAGLGFAITLIALGIAIRYRRAWAVWPSLAASLVFFALVCLQPWRPLLRPGILEITAIDVGQGESLFIVFPNGQTMLVDAGGFPGMERMVRKPQIDMGEDVVSPYLWSRRLRHLDYAALSHGHSDHMAGLPAVLDNFQPGALWIGAEPASDEWRNVEQHAAAHNVKIVPLHRGVPDLLIGGTRIRILAPSADYVPEEKAGNNDSLVFELTYGKQSILLTGDAELPVEQDLVSSGLLRPVTLLKAGHHGSRTSSSEEFVTALQPKFAFISDGYMNQFHHPHKLVLARMANHHTAVYRTDQRGLISFQTDGEHVSIQTFH